MSEIVMNSIESKSQNDFIRHYYPEFISNALYGFLFEGLQLRDIERKYLMSDNLQGFFAKSVLNYAGIDTSKKSKNRGTYAGRNVKDVAELLMNCQDIRLNNIGECLLQYRH